MAKTLCCRRKGTIYKPEHPDSMLILFDSLYMIRSPLLFILLQTLHNEEMLERRLEANDGIVPRLEVQSIL
jgi:hypothetical protein